MPMHGLRRRHDEERHRFVEQRTHPSWNTCGRVVGPDRRGQLRQRLEGGQAGAVRRLLVRQRLQQLLHERLPRSGRQRQGQGAQGRVAERPRLLVRVVAGELGNAALRVRHAFQALLGAAEAAPRQRCHQRGDSHQERLLFVGFTGFLERLGPSLRHGHGAGDVGGLPRHFPDDAEALGPLLAVLEELDSQRVQYVLGVRGQVGTQLGDQQREGVGDRRGVPLGHPASQRQQLLPKLLARGGAHRRRPRRQTGLGRRRLGL
mmetsp:Transcript_46755/g.141891  ORF Transcript_46755/g.141891 Transcript_46755/m.141891 type:complete len:261 (-) Transcript_46755:58-840(-)